MASESISTKDIIDMVSGVIVIAGAVVGIWWFFVQRMHARQVEFDVDATIIKSEVGPTIAECILTFRNKGKVRVVIPRINFRARTFNKGDTVKKFDAARLEFRHPLFDIENLVESIGFPSTYLEPGITQHYRLATDVPDEAIFILVHGKFGYGEYWEHTAEKVVPITKHRNMIAEA